MIKEDFLDGLKPGDRVFEKGGIRVKVRLHAEPLIQQNKILGPAAFRLHLTAAVCDQNGKALPRADGAYCIFPHTVTLAGFERPAGAMDPFAEIEPVLERLIDQALASHQGVQGVERFLSDWRARAPLGKIKKSPAGKAAKQIA